MMLGVLVSVAHAQPQIEPLWPIPTPVMKQALGFNVASNSQAATEAAWRAHASEIRYQPAWSSVEDYDTGVFSLNSKASDALDWCQTYGIEPILVAAYAPPWKNILTLTVAGNVPVGSYVIPVQESVSSVDPPYCHVLQEGNIQIVNKWAYYGGLIDSVDTNAKTLTLASATTVALTNGTQLRINRLRYPSCANQTASDPSIQAYRQYVLFLANELDSRGMPGRIELWNEPSWKHDTWDHRGHFYDNPPPALTGVWGDPTHPQSPNFGFVDALRGDTLPSGVTLVWAGTNKSGATSLLGGRMITPLVETETSTFAFESLHPYCKNQPELDILPDAMIGGDSVWGVTISGGNTTSNFRNAMNLNVDNWDNEGWGIRHVVSECGLKISDPQHIFADTFMAHTNDWTHIGTGTSKATIGTDPNDGSTTAWYPSEDSTGGVTSNMTFEPLSILDAPLSVEMNVRVDDVDNRDANRFSITLYESGTGGCIATLCVRPGSKPYLGFYDTSGNLIYQFLDNHAFPDTQTYVTFRLTITHNGDGMMSLAGDYFDTTTQSYVSLGSPVTDASTQTGVFDRLSIWARNAPSLGNRVYFHSVSIRSDKQGLRFVDELYDNQNAWSNIGSSSGQATIGTDPNGNGEWVWYPSQDATDAVTSQIDIASVSIRQAPINVDMRVRVDANHGDANRFSINLYENGVSPYYAKLCIRPGSEAYIGYLDSQGNPVTHFVNNVTFTDTTTYVTFRLTLTDNGDGTMTLAASMYDLVTADFVSLGNPATDAATQTGVFDSLLLWSRNAGGTTDNQVFINHVDITSPTPPGFARQATCVLREYLNFLGSGMDRINFYRLQGSDFGFTEDDLSPRQSFTAIQALMEDAMCIEYEPINLVDGVPTVSNYDGTNWTLMTTPIVGCDNPLATDNTVLFAMWQRNYASYGTNFVNAVPAKPVSVTLAIPSGFVADIAWNTRTRQGVKFTVDGNSVSLLIGSDPVIIKIIAHQ